jgi:hypothetical protein
MLKPRYVSEATIRQSLVSMGYSIPREPYINYTPTKNVNELLPFDLIDGIDNKKNSLEKKFK